MGTPAPLVQGSSPLTRGKLEQTRGEVITRRLIPAHAGKTPWIELDPAAPAAHPRSRGENLQPDETVEIRAGSSPLTRGKPGVRYSVHWVTGLIPAHAGKTITNLLTCNIKQAHPRSRGENATPGTEYAVKDGSSPLTRGKRRG